MSTAEQHFDGQQNHAAVRIFSLTNCFELIDEMKKIQPKQHVGQKKKEETPKETSP